MKVKILSQTSIAGVPARVGDVFEVSDADARLLLGNGKAEQVADAPVVTEEPAPAPAKRKPRTKVTTDGDLPADA
jgi:hypothetical protein